MAEGHDYVSDCEKALVTASDTAWARRTHKTPVLSLCTTVVFFLEQELTLPDVLSLSLFGTHFLTIFVYALPPILSCDT